MHRILAEILVKFLDFEMTFPNISIMFYHYTVIITVTCVHSLGPVVWGIGIQPTFALVRVVKGD